MEYSDREILNNLKKIPLRFGYDNWIVLIIKCN